MTQIYTHVHLLKPGDANGELKVLNLWQIYCVLCVALLSPVWRDSLVSAAKTHVALVDRVGYRAVTISDFHWRIIVVKKNHDNIIAI